MEIAWTLFALIIGCLIPFQGIITSNLSRQIQHPYGSAFINFFGGMLVFFIMILLSPIALPSFKKLTSIPWYLYSGGIVGSLFIFGALFALPKIGSAAFFGQIVIGQLIITVVVDHFGLFGLPVHKVDLFRIAGVVLLIVGALLILRK